MIRVIVVDDHAVVREGLAGLLANYDEIAVIASVGDGERAVEQDEGIERWLRDPRLRALLREDRDERRLAQLPLASFLHIL